jgi:hypothetical protein
VTFVPLPQHLRHDAPALLTVELPREYARQGRLFRVIVHQLSGRPRRVIGSFELAIPVVSRGEIVEDGSELRDFEVLRRNAARLRRDDRWMPVMHRYVEHLEARVRALFER